VLNYPNYSILNQPGIGLRGPHLFQVLNEKPNINWLEVHAENFFSEGGEHIEALQKIRENYPLSVHGVGLSLGTTDELNKEHLKKLKQVVTRFEPALLSEHLSWGAVHNQYFNDLLPLPYTEESLQNFCDKVKQTQDFLNRQILIENPSSYLRYRESTIPEWEFYSSLPEKTGCGLLLDVNNFFVSGFNHEFDPLEYLRAVNPKDVKEIHLAGFATKELEQGTLLIDDHGSLVDDRVWELFVLTMQKVGSKPVLIEWDTGVPDLSVLLNEANKAGEYMLQYEQVA
jgi:uncharacterized protein (UPF0276 family)